jgi:hypothetical protein
MIRPLRQRHRVMVCALGVVLPMAFVAGIAARKPVPVTAALPSQLVGNAKDFGTSVLTKTNLWPGQRIITILRRDDGGSVAVELMVRDLVKPDVLVYWAAGREEGGTEGLPDNARLLGALSTGAPLPVPSEARGEAGRFILYSLADHQVVAAASAFVIQKD